MNKNGIIYVVLILVFLVIMHFGKAFLLSRYTVKLMNSISKDDQSFFKLVDSFGCKMLFEPFNRDFMKLNYYILHDDEKNVQEQYHKLESHKLSKDQTLAIYEKIFKYYITKNNRQQAIEIYDKVKKYLKEKELDNHILLNYEKDIKVYLDKDMDAIKLLDDMIQKSNQQYQSMYYIEKAYVLKHNNYLDQAKECIKNVIELSEDEQEKQVMKDLLDSNLQAL
ncbi:MAG: hypothetical protein ACI4U3_08140 [Traorella sp.]